MGAVRIRVLTRLLLSVAVSLGCVALLDACLQFRMSRGQIDRYFEGKPYRGVIHEYKVESRTIRYLQAGAQDRPTVVFVHGSPGSLSAFIDFMVDSVLLQKAHLLSVDRPGFGHSDFGRAARSLQEQSALLRPMVERYAPVILVGHSLGGPLIAQMAVDYPQAVAGLIIVAGSVDPDLEPNEWFRGPFSVPPFRWLLPRSFRASNDEIYRVKPQLEELRPRWREIEVPITVIQGMRDRLVPPANAEFAERMAQKAHVRVVLLEDVNHFIPWTHPGIIREEILDMLKRRHE